MKSRGCLNRDGDLLLINGAALVWLWRRVRQPHGRSGDGQQQEGHGHREAQLLHVRLHRQPVRCGPGVLADDRRPAGDGRSVRQQLRPDHSADADGRLHAAGGARVQRQPGAAAEALCARLRDGVCGWFPAGAGGLTTERSADVWRNDHRIPLKYVTLDHKTCHKGTFFEIEIYTSSESWINKLVRIEQYLAETQLFENLQSEGAKKSKYWENCH